MPIPAITPLPAQEGKCNRYGLKGRTYNTNKDR
jgi:hypothetical protein